MLIAVLVMIWVIALGVMGFRRFADRRADTSVDRFHYRTWLFRRVYPTLALVGTSPDALASAPTPEEREVQYRAERARIKRRRERRRRVLREIGLVIAATLVLGAIPPLRTLWDVTFASVVLGAAYVGLAATAARNETLSLERLRKIVPLGPTIPGDGALPATFVSAVGRYGSAAVAPMPRRPAFVLVDAPNA